MAAEDSSFWATVLNDYATPAIAVLAFLQYWAILFWLRFIRKGKIEIHETLRIEVGYHEAGPSLGIHGALRGLNRDLFVEHISLRLTKLKDSSKHEFVWGVFRTRQFSGTGEDRGTMEIPYGFLLSPTSPRRFNIQFHDWLAQDEMRRALEPFTQDWYKVVNALYAKVAASQTPPGVLYTADLRKELSETYDAFRSQASYGETYISLDRRCYWEEGAYEIEMEVVTSNPKGSFTKKWSFNLTADAAERLRFNTNLILDYFCNRPRYEPYYFAEPTLEPDS